jgi:hypothetical protein
MVQPPDDENQNQPPHQDTNPPDDPTSPEPQDEGTPPHTDDSTDAEDTDSEPDTPDTPADDDNDADTGSEPDASGTPADDSDDEEMPAYPDDDSDDEEMPAYPDDDDDSTGEAPSDEGVPLYPDPDDETFGPASSADDTDIYGPPPDAAPEPGTPAEESADLPPGLTQQQIDEDLARYLAQNDDASRYPPGGADQTPYPIDDDLSMYQQYPDDDDDQGRGGGGPFSIRVNRDSWLPLIIFIGLIIAFIIAFIIPRPETVTELPGPAQTATAVAELAALSPEAQTATAVAELAALPPEAQTATAVAELAALSPEAQTATAVAELAALSPEAQTATAVAELAALPPATQTAIAEGGVAAFDQTRTAVVQEQTASPTGGTSVAGRPEPPYPGPSPVGSPVVAPPTNTPPPTNTLLPTNTPRPTNTPLPTNTLAPTSPPVQVTVVVEPTIPPEPLPPTEPPPPPTEIPSPTPIPPPTAIPDIVIAGDQRWTAQQSPVVLDRNVRVAPGAVLIIEPGTEIRLRPAVSIIVNGGQILSLGQPDRPVRFVSDSGARWEGIFLEPNSFAVFEHTQINGGGSGGTLIAANSSELAIRNARIYDNGGAIILNDTKLEVRDSEITGNDIPFGATISAVYQFGNYFTLINNRIGGNRLSEQSPGVHVSNYNTRQGVVLDVRNNLIRGGIANFKITTDGPMYGTLACNTLIGDQVGLGIRTQTLQVPPIEVDIFQNFIDGHTPVIEPVYLDFGIGRGATSEILTDMRDNWWGDSSGPYHPEENVEGRGEAVGTNILYEPWLTSPPPCAPPE